MDATNYMKERQSIQGYANQNKRKFVPQNTPCYSSTIVHGGNIGLMVTNLAVSHRFPFEKVLLVSYIYLYISHIYIQLCENLGVEILAHSKIVGWINLAYSIPQFPSWTISHQNFYVTLLPPFLFLPQSRPTAFMLPPTHSLLCILPHTEKPYDKFSLFKMHICNLVWIIMHGIGFKSIDTGTRLLRLKSELIH